MKKTFFNTDHEKYEWLMAHPEAIDANEQRWLDWYGDQSVGGCDSPVKFRQSQD